MSESITTLEKCGLGVARAAMRLACHDPSWTDGFRAESQRARGVLAGDLLGVEHIGSTAVPDLIAKPILDIGIRVGGVADFEACVAPMESLGYTYRGRNGEDPLRRYFVLEAEGVRFVQPIRDREGSVHRRVARVRGNSDQFERGGCMAPTPECR